MNRNLFSSPAVLTAALASAIWLALRFLLPAIDAPVSALQTLSDAPSLLFMVYMPFMAFNLLLSFQGRPAIAQTFMLYTGATIGGLLIASGGWAVGYLVINGMITPGSLTVLMNPMFNILMGLIFVGVSELNSRR